MKVTNKGHRICYVSLFCLIPLCMINLMIVGAQNRETFLSKTQTEVRVKWKYGLPKEKSRGIKLYIQKRFLDLPLLNIK